MKYLFCTNIILFVVMHKNLRFTNVFMVKTVFCLFFASPLA